MSAAITIALIQGLMVVKIIPATWTRTIPKCELIEVQIPVNFYLEGE